MTDPSSNVYSTDEEKSKRIIVHKIYRRTVPQTKTNQNKASSTKFYRRTIPRTWTKYVQRGKTNQNTLLRKQKDEGDEFTYDVPSSYVSNIFERGINNPDVSYEKAYMATSGHEYFTDIIDQRKEYHYRHSQRLSSKKLKEAVRRVMEQEEE